MCLRKIWSRRFLDSPHHLLDGFWGPQDGFFGFSSGGYRDRGEEELPEKENHVEQLLKVKDVETAWKGKWRISSIASNNSLKHQFQTTVCHRPGWLRKHDHQRTKR